LIAISIMLATIIEVLDTFPSRTFRFPTSPEIFLRQRRSDLGFDQLSAFDAIFFRRPTG